MQEFQATFQQADQSTGDPWRWLALPILLIGATHAAGRP